MSGYDILLSNGNLLTTVNVKTVDVRQNSPLYLIGQGIPDYGTMIADNFVWMLENFASVTPPVHPLAGQEWFDLTKLRLNVYSSGEWVPLLTGRSVEGSLFDMLPAATNVDFATAGTTAIFTASGSHTYYPTSVILVPTGTFDATTSATVNLRVASSGDVLSSTVVTSGVSTRFWHVAVNAGCRQVATGESVSVEVTIAATGGAFNFKVYLFGFTI